MFHFSMDGKLLVSGGHNKKAVLWYTDTLKPKVTLEEHFLLITDVRFGPSTPRLATSSFDKTVRVWDAADNPGYALQTFTGHSASVMSLNFHPSKEDLICSCERDGEICYWSINNGSCVRFFKGSAMQMGFQPRYGTYLATAAENIVSILDVETQTCIQSFQSLELSDISEYKTMTLPAHDGLFVALAASNANGLVASVSHDKLIKLLEVKHHHLAPATDAMSSRADPLTSSVLLCSH